MLLGEPQATQADLHFRIFGFPVRVHPFFWVVALFMGLGSGPADPQKTLVWVAVVFVSVLLHEMGHASIQRLYGGHPWITLYALGGLASCNDGPRTPWRRILVLIAGPGAGFLLAMLIIAIMRLGGQQIGLTTIQEWNSDAALIPDGAVPVSLIGRYVGFFQGFHSGVVNTAVRDLLYVNIFWGVLNLLPVFPLDGGQIARELFSIRDPRSGVVQALQLSAGIAVLIAAYALLNEQFYLGLMFGYLAYSNFQSMQFQQNRWR